VRVPVVPVAAVLLALALAGCGSAPKPSASGSVTIDGRIDSTLVGTNLEWTAHLRNTGSATTTGHSVHLSISYNNAPNLPADTADADMPPLAPGATQDVTLRTPYHGLGDYGGPFEVWQGDLTLAHTFAFYEKCTGAC